MIEETTFEWNYILKNGREVTFNVWCQYDYIAENTFTPPPAGNLAEITLYGAVVNYCIDSNTGEEIDLQIITDQKFGILGYLPNGHVGHEVRDYWSWKFFDIANMSSQIRDELHEQILEEHNTT